MTSGLGLKRALGVGIATLVLLASGAVAANVSSLAAVLPAGVELPVQVPTIAVKTPTVPVKTPTVPVKTPTIPVKTPTVPVVTLTVPVKTPTVPVKTPTVPVKTPTAPVKAPTPTAPSKPPPIKVPTGSGTVPSNGAAGVPSQTPVPKLPSISPGTPSVPSTISSAAARIGTKGSGSVVAASRGAVDAGTVGSPGGERVTGGVAEYPIAFGSGGSSSPSPGYGTFPEPPDVARILAQEGDHALDNREIKQLVLGLRGCLSFLPHQLRAVLELRTGVGQTQAMDAGSVASHLGISRQRVLMLEPVALKRLRSAGTQHSCAVPGTELAEQALASYLSISPGSGTGAGGVDGALYFKAPSGSGPSVPVATGTADETGALHAVRPGSPLFWTILLALAGLLLIGFLFVDNLGIGRRHRPRGWRRS
jgi:hypothetical protein